MKLIDNSRSWMKVKSWILIGAVFVSASLWGFEKSSSQRPGPRFEQAPPSAPYIPDRSSKSEQPPACPADFTSNPEPGIVEKAGEGITPPKITQYVTVQITKQGQDAYGRNLFKDPNDVVSKISIVVDKKGKPTNLCLQSPAGFDLDILAANAVRQYRFKPGMKDGKQVPMRMTILVTYATH